MSAMYSNASPGVTVFLTGSTGFVGKVVLEELLRQRTELQIERVFLLIRSGKDRTAQERFLREVVASPCFSMLPKDWPSLCKVVAGDVTQVGLGLSPKDEGEVLQNVTHMMHCAASVEFDLPLAEATEINVTGALNVLALAKRMPHLKSFVDVSTAYVTPHRGDDVPVREELVTLPFSAAKVYRDIRSGIANEKALLKLTGHANTYTFTKCLAEALLAEKQEGIPLTIVRPSIISACWRFPFPGWIDSKAAFAGFVALFGIGHLRVVNANPETILDIVPCDEVANRVLRAAFDTSPRLQSPGIHYAVAGPEHSGRIADITALMTEYFRTHPQARKGSFARISAIDWRWRLDALRYHHAPIKTGEYVFKAMRRPKQAKQAARLADMLGYLNKAFPYFTHHTFLFQSSFGMSDPDFRMPDYIRATLAGISKHLLRRNPERIHLGGRVAKALGSDLKWAFTQPTGNLTVRLLAVGLRNALRLAAEEVSFDEKSFEKALDKMHQGDLIVLAPTHRSYMDFMLCSLLPFAHPQLGLQLPRIAATDDFSRLPLVSGILERAGAFFIKRGTGKEDPALTRRIHDLAAKKQSLEFFIEGTRSRSRRFLTPKRGLLRALQNTGQPCVILPISVNHDRVAEEAGFLRELLGQPRPPSSVVPLARWFGSLVRGNVKLGHVTIRCGEPVRLEHGSDLHAVSRNIMAELQRNTVTTTHHLRTFLAHHPDVVNEAGMTLDLLIEAIRVRGGSVMVSELQDEPSIAPLVERSFQAQWMHVFYADALALAPKNLAVKNHITRNGFIDFLPANDAAPPVPALVQALFAPICRDHTAVLDYFLARPGTGTISARELVRTLEGAFLPDVENALDDLTARGVLSCANGVYTVEDLTPLDALRWHFEWRPHSNLKQRITA